MAGAPPSSGRVPQRRLSALPPCASPLERRRGWPAATGLATAVRSCGTAAPTEAAGPLAQLALRGPRPAQRMRARVRGGEGGGNNGRLALTVRGSGSTLAPVVDGSPRALVAGRASGSSASAGGSAGRLAPRGMCAPFGPAAVRVAWAGAVRAVEGASPSRGAPPAAEMCTASPPAVAHVAVVTAAPCAMSPAVACRAPPWPADRGLMAFTLEAGCPFRRPAPVEGGRAGRSRLAPRPTAAVVGRAVQPVDSLTITQPSAWEAAPDPVAASGPPRTAGTGLPGRGQRGCSGAPSPLSAPGWGDAWGGGPVVLSAAPADAGGGSIDAPGARSTRAGALLSSPCRSPRPPRGRSLQPAGEACRSGGVAASPRDSRPRVARASASALSSRGTCSKETLTRAAFKDAMWSCALARRATRAGLEVL